MMRQMIIRNYAKKPPQELGRVVLRDDNTIELQNLPQILHDQLTQGIREQKGSDKRIMPTDGVKFFSALKKEFSGTYVRAVEETV